MTFADICLGGRGEIITHKRSEAEVRYAFIRQRPVTPLRSTTVEPLRPKSDQRQFSPNIINTLSRKKVLRIKKMIRTGLFKARLR